MNHHAFNSFRGLILLLAIIYNFMAFHFMNQYYVIWCMSQTTVNVGYLIAIIFLLVIGVSVHLINVLSLKFSDTNFYRFYKLSFITLFIVVYSAYISHWTVGGTSIDILIGVLAQLGFFAIFLVLSKRIPKYVWGIIGIALSTIPLFLILLDNYTFVGFTLPPLLIFEDHNVSMLATIGLIFLGYAFSEPILNLFNKINFRFRPLEWVGEKSLWIYIHALPLLQVLIAVILMNISTYMGYWRIIEEFLDCY